MALYPLYIPTFISSVTYEPVRVLPHVYFYNGVKQTNQFWIQGFNANKTALNYFSTNNFPYFDNYSGNTPTSESLSLLFNNETSIYGDTPTGSLYSEYWETYINLLYNPRTRLINASAIIPLADYFKMELNDIVQWRGNFYHLRAINDYNLRTGECGIQLLGPIIKDVAPPVAPDCSFTFDTNRYVCAPCTLYEASKTGGQVNADLYFTDCGSGETTSVFVGSGFKRVFGSLTIPSSSTALTVTDLGLVEYNCGPYEECTTETIQVVTDNDFSQYSYIDPNTCLWVSGLQQRLDTVSYEVIEGSLIMFGTGSSTVTANGISDCCLAPTTTTTLSPTTTTTTLVPTTTTTLTPTTTTLAPTTTTLAPTTTTLAPTTTTLAPTTTTIAPTTTTTLVPTTTIAPTTTTTLVPTTSTTLAPTTSTTTLSLSRLFTFEVTSSLNNAYSIDTKLFINLTGSFVPVTGTQTINANSDISFSGVVNLPPAAPFILQLDIYSGSNSIGAVQGPNNYYDVIMVDTYDNGLAPLSSSYLGNGGQSIQPRNWGVDGFWSASLWNNVTRTAQIQPSVNRNLVLYNMSGSNGFASYALAKPYLTSSGSIATTVGILPASQSFMQNGWLQVPAYNTDYTTRYQANISANRFYIGEFNNKREIVKFTTDTFNTSSNVWVQRLDNKTTLPIDKKSINNMGGAIIPTSPCNGLGTSTSDLYYNQENGSFFVLTQAYGTYNSTWVNQNIIGTPAFSNAACTIAMGNDTFGAFEDVSGLEGMSGNYTPASDGHPYVVYRFSKSASTPVRVSSQFECP
jgi:hypothetical protein